MNQDDWDAFFWEMVEQEYLRSLRAPNTFGIFNTDLPDGLGDSLLLPFLGAETTQGTPVEGPKTLYDWSQLGKSEEDKLLLGQWWIEGDLIYGWGQRKGMLEAIPMMYQVVYRRPDGKWMEWSGALSGHQVEWNRRQCELNNPDCPTRVIEATSVEGFARMVERMNEQVVEADPAPVPSAPEGELPPPPANLWSLSAADKKRIEMEKGASDHDKPYRFSADRAFLVGREALHKWVELEQKVRKGELEP